MAQIRIQDLVKAFGPTKALAGIALDVADGEVVALLGPSGCGKTTLLRCIAGLETPTSGTITVGGTVLASNGTSVPPAQRNIAMVFQSYALWPHMTVAGNVAFGLTIQKLPKPQIAERVAEALGLLGLSHLAERYPGQLSGGQQQRVAVARALALRADVVLFDEPLSNLDLRLREQVRHDLKRVLSELRLTAVYVTHDFGEAVVVADRIAMLQAGRIAQLGTPKEIYHGPANQYVAQFVGDVNTLPARVERAGGSVRLVVSDALSFDAARAVGTVPDGAATVQLMIRPEYVQLEPASDEAGPVGTVTQTQFVGQVTETRIMLGAIDLRAIGLSQPGDGLEPGSKAHVRIKDANVVIMAEA